MPACSLQFASYHETTGRKKALGQLMFSAIVAVCSIRLRLEYAEMTDLTGHSVVLYRIYLNRGHEDHSASPSFLQAYQAWSG